VQLFHRFHVLLPAAGQGPFEVHCRPQPQ
jgi:hypothetical protein